jgi:hypothetical protein
MEKETMYLFPINSQAPLGTLCFYLRMTALNQLFFNTPNRKIHNNSYIKENGKKEKEAILTYCSSNNSN